MIYESLDSFPDSTAQLFFDIRIYTKTNLLMEIHVAE